LEWGGVCVCVCVWLQTGAGVAGGGGLGGDRGIVEKMGRREGGKKR
jgi:hypothetical protein